MKLSDHRPRPKLVTGVTQIERPRFPAIDTHNHLGASTLTPDSIWEMVDEMIDTHGGLLPEGICSREACLV